MGEGLWRNVVSGKFHLKKASDGQFHFNLLAANGEIILSSELYRSKSSALAGIESVRKNAGRVEAFEVKRSSGGKYHFVLKATNGQVIGQSQHYSSVVGVESGVVAVRRLAPQAYLSDSSGFDDGVRALGSVRTFLQGLESIMIDGSSVLFFRGHGDARYNLVPSVYRDDGWINNEHVIFHELMLRCPGDFDLSGSTFNTLVKMQHYSLPTRLLDITSNPLIALYFACSDRDKVDGEVVVFRIPKEDIKYFDSDTVSLISNIGRLSSDFCVPDVVDDIALNEDLQVRRLVREVQREKPHFEARVRVGDLNSVVCVKPVLDNPRVVKQDGAFLLFGVEGNKRSPAQVPSNYLLPKNEVRLIINGAEKKRILGQLEALGITRSTIYPEIEHVAGYIKEMYKSLA